MEFLVGFGFVTLGGFGFVQWKDAVKDEAVVAKKTADLVADTKSYSNLNSVPHGFRGIMALNMNGMTHLNGLVSVRKQAVRKIETLVENSYPYETEEIRIHRDGHGRRHTHTHTESHTHTHTERTIESTLHWKLLTRRLLPLNVPNLSLAPYVDGVDPIKKSLRKTRTEIGTASQIQASLASNFGINYDCHGRRGHMFRWNHYSFNNNMLYFGGKKEVDTFHADKIGLSAESVAGLIMKPESDEVRAKYLGAGTMITVGVIGAIGCALSRV